MKKVLLSLSMLAAVMVANAQTVGVGTYDDFAASEYGTDAGGIFWWTPTTPASVVNYYTLKRNVSNSGVLEIVVNKTTSAASSDQEKYAPFGFGFGDDNGAAADGNKFSIDITANKMLTFKYKASAGAPLIKVKLKDVNGKEIEVRSVGTAANWYDNAQQFTVTASQTFQTATFDFNGAKGVRCYGADPVGSPSTPACTGFEFSTAFDFAKVVEVDFFVNPGDASYAGTITFDDVKFGSTPKIGLGTSSAAANIASTKVFPNPTTGEFTAEVSLVNNVSVSIILTDMMGKQIATKSTTNGSVSFDTAGLAKGMYTVTYVLDGTPAKTELVVVK